LIRIRTLLGALLLAAPATAHQETMAYSRLSIRESGEVEYALKIPVEDLAEPLGREGHAALNGPEVRAAEEPLFDHFQPLVSISSAGKPCPVERAGIDVPEDERLYGELRFVFHCPPAQPVTLDYRVFFDVDPGHMGMLEVEGPGGKARAELISERPRWQIDASQDGPPQLQHIDPGTDEARELAEPGRAAAPSIAVQNAPAAKVDSAAERPTSRTSRPPAPSETPSSISTSWRLFGLALVVVLAAGSLTLRAARRRSEQ
jgi:hypothetical protein